jgi:hypothetical protein
MVACVDPLAIIVVGVATTVLLEMDMLVGLIVNVMGEIVWLPPELVAMMPKLAPLTAVVALVGTVMTPVEVLSVSP